MTFLTEIIKEKERDLAYFGKQLTLLKDAELSPKEKEELSKIFSEKIAELNGHLSRNYEQLEKQKENQIIYSNPLGVWKVTTEGDVEGRSTEQLGTYAGYLDFIAYQLADKAYYSLEFTKLSPQPYIQPIKARPITGEVEVHVQLNIESGTWGPSKEEEEHRYKFFLYMLKDREHVSIRKGQYYSSVRLIINPNAKLFVKGVEN